MIYALSQKYQKSVALLLITVFYAEFVLAGYNQIRQNNQGRYQANSNSYIKSGKNEFLNNMASSSDNAGIEEFAFSKNDPSFELMTSGEVPYNIVEDSTKISGPSQPEMSSFKSVGSDNMVDLFTGDFSYNVPLMDVGGYPVNIFYKSGISMDQEASWVGLGWNINPGTITRNMRGLPDDFDGSNDQIKKTQSIKENKTIGATLGADFELFGLPSASYTIGASYNTYKGWGLETGINASLMSGDPSKGGLTGGMSLSLNNSTQDGLTVTPSISLTLSKKMGDDMDGAIGSSTLSNSLSYNTRSGLKALQVSTGFNVKTFQRGEVGNISGDLFSSSISFASPSYTPTISIPYTSRQITFTGKLGNEKWGAFNNASVSAYFSRNAIAALDTTISMPAYGYLNYQSASGNLSALLDFNREKDIPYHEKPVVPNIGVPSYTYDLFSIAGEGTGGMFRAYRGDIGYVYDHLMSSKSESESFSGDVGIGALVHVGVDLNQNYAVTQTGPWINNNALKNSIGFKKSDSVFEAAYFRNPGEKSVNSKAFYDAVGGDDVVTADLYQASISSPDIIATNNLKRYRNAVQVGTSVLSSAVYKKKRDKRSEIITYLTAQEASTVGLSKYIENYTVNRWGLRNCNKNFSGSVDTMKINDTVSIEKRVNSFRKANHISEINVLNPDGRRYVYGIPVYNLLEKDVTASVNAVNGNMQEGIVKFNAEADNPIKHPDSTSIGRDNYYSKEEIPGYAHSFLLTAILSSDYSDITGDGISDDDLGDAIKFNYSKVSGIANPYQWRAPYITDSATYNEGLRTDLRDDRASYIYGKKELWYINSIESKNMIATFTLDTTADRLPADENGYKNGVRAARKLTAINLYSKADFLQNGVNAKPIKTVHFEYSYALCPGVNRPVNATTGKLTLTGIWFSYNGNTKKQNYYRFYYNTLNPNYTTKSNDRWGTYKDPMQNPGYVSTNYISNAEYPYAIQVDSVAAKNAAAWTLDSIVLPSNASIKVNYESDDYAFVQNKRAMQMFKVMGFKQDTSDILTQNLYDVLTTNGNLIVYAKVTDNVSNAQEVFNKYLQGINKLFFKLHIAYGAGYEFVPCYADIDLSGGANQAYGIVSGDSKQIYFKIKGININANGDGNYSPLAKAATGFLRLNLPSLAYPGSDVGDKVDLKEAVSMVVGLITNVTDAFSQFDVGAMWKGLGNHFDSSRSFVRLNNPVYKKLGGGLRVKKIMIYDNWKAMTTVNSVPGQRESIYGQEYTYTTSKEINGVQTKISSGVACYEPSIGGEENPWKQPLEYVEKVAPLAPTALGYTETPLGEGFFPSAFVGYSQVNVRSIHADTVKSSNGYEVTKFFTTYDFPTITDFTTLIDNKKRYKPAIANFLHINAKHFIAVSQGFKIELNDMNGKMRSHASYPKTDSLNAIAFSENFYRVDDQSAEFKHLSNRAYVIDPSGVVDTTGTIGKDIELMADLREQRSVTEGANIQLNVDVIPLIFPLGVTPFPIPSLWFMPQREEDLYRSVAMTKVIQRYGVLDSVIQVDKGSRVSSKNLLFDSETGDVLLTKTQNEFNDPVYNFTYPAHWAYSGMGPAYKNIQAIFNSDSSNMVTISNGVLSSTSKYPGMVNYFESGDEILATGYEKTGEIAPGTDCWGNETACSQNIWSTSITSKLIWAIDAKKSDPSSTAGVFFIDRNGSPYSATNLRLKIIRSGRRNMSMNPVGSLTFLSNPLKTVSGKLMLVLDSNSNVVASSAVGIKDYWKAAESRKPTPIDYTCTCAPLKALFDYLIASKRLFIQQSNGVTVDSIVHAASLAGYPVTINDCGLLTSNKTGLFYALTTDTSGTIYRAQIGNVTIAITSNVLKQIAFYSLQSKACGNDGKVYYQDNSKTQFLYQLHRKVNFNVSYAYIDCQGNTNTPNLTRTDTCLYALLGKVYAGTNIDTTRGHTSYCPTGETLIPCDTNAIFLSVEACSNCPAYNCYNAILDTIINPYVYGILGNWRSDKAYVYYGDRQQTDFTNATDIRKNGAIKSFIPYWSFGATSLQASVDSTRWVWNAQTTLFNRKGFELENKDPLGRYNSGQYGYNETMPVSVTQNSKFREQFFDGFEDYGYDNKSCTEACVVPRSIDFTKGNGFLSTLYSHSGKYSLKINAGDSVSLNTKVIVASKDTVSAKLTYDMQSKYLRDTIVTLNGTGLTAAQTGQGKIWYGNLITKYTGFYTIRETCRGEATLNHTGKFVYTFSVGNNTVISDSVSDGVPRTDSLVHIFLVAGTTYQMIINAKYSIQNAAYTFAKPSPITWTQLSGCQTVSALSDANILNNSTNPSVIINIDTCTVLKDFKTDSAALLPSYTLTKGGKYWFSAWVKEEQDCLCQKYTNNQVRFVYTDSANQQTTDTAKPTGIIIEGWQRYDFVFSVPVNAASMTLKLKSTGSTNIYFDDIRLHPYNANMQTFVYNPVNLRLMAQLDENNYASFYEYDDDGTLIRVKKETERGIQTIKETRSYLVR
ncbi:MAG: hypothetical protein EAZ16_12740 [Sphingobacteriales bacterium]|nr:MAG: hypothetical protein EAZ16_12740 [Sphingobacteriales bacterium]